MVFTTEFTRRPKDAPKKVPKRPKPKTTQDGPRRRRTPQDAGRRPNTPQKEHKTLTRRAQGGPKTAQRRRKTPPRRCKTSPQNAPRRPQRASKTAQYTHTQPTRRPQNAPRVPQDVTGHPKTPSRGSQRPQEAHQVSTKTCTSKNAHANSLETPAGFGYPLRSGKDSEMSSTSVEQ